MNKTFTKSLIALIAIFCSTLSANAQTTGVEPEDGGEYYIYCPASGQFVIYKDYNVALDNGQKTLWKFEKSTGGSFKISTKPDGDDYDYFLALGSGRFGSYPINVFSENGWKISGNNEYTLESDTYEGVYLIVANSISGLQTNANNATKFLFIPATPASTSEAITINSSHTYATCITNNALDFSSAEGIKAYVVTAVGTSSVTLTEVEKVPAGTPLVVKGVTANVPVIESATAPATNLLVAATEDHSAVSGDYVFSKQDGEYGFYPAKEGLKIAKGKAYLAGVSAAKGLSFSFDDESTAINVIETNTTTSVRKAIVNGRLVIMTPNGNFTATGAQVK